VTDWVFQCNPDRYDVDAAVAEGLDQWWSTPRYRSRIAVGDRVWLTVVGRRNPGVYYLAKVTSPPYETNLGEFGRWRTDIYFTHRVDPPLPRGEILTDPALRECRALRGFQGTNEPLAPEQASRLWDVVQDRLQPLTGKPVQDGLAVGQAIERHTDLTRRQLRDAILALSPRDFELLVVRVLQELGFDVEHTGQTGDGGIDAEAVLSLGGLTAVSTKVQAKRWTNTVSGRTVRELRGALRIDERGLIITTSDFTADARKEAQAEGKTRIGLMSGDQLVNHCLDHSIGVIARSVVLYKLDPEGLVGGDQNT